jgi:hypothetical protein
MSVINPKNKVMILSIDGGGLRGIIPTRILEKLEEIEEKPCREIFKLMTGTSTGAIIVACLAVGMKAKEIVKLYKEKARLVFRPVAPFRLWRKTHWRYEKYGIKKLFKEYFGDITLKELPVDIMITSKDTIRSETMFFEKKTFGNMYLRDAVEASMSAPGFFKPYGRFIDGGVGAFNNTCYQAVVEAIHYLGYPRGMINLISLGTGRYLNYMKKGEAEKTTLFGWLAYALGEGMDDANDEQVEITRREYVRKGEIEFKRYQLSFDEETFKTLNIPLHWLRNKKYFAMDAFRHVDKLDLLAKNFADYITFKEKDGIELGKRPELDLKEFKQYFKK